MRRIHWYSSRGPLALAAFTLAIAAAIVWSSRSPAEPGAVPRADAVRSSGSRAIAATPASLSRDGEVLVAHDAVAAAIAAVRARIGDSATPAETMSALHQLAASEPALAIDVAHALGSTPEEKVLWVADLAERWAARDPQGSWDWLAQLTPTRMRDLATGTLPERVVGVLAKATPELLLRNVDAAVRQGERPVGVPPVVAVHLAVAALTENGKLELAQRSVEAWARDPAQPPIGEAAYVCVAAALARSSTEAAGAWLTTLPVSAARDVALTEFPAQLAQQQSPGAAVEWAEHHVPADLRAAALQRTFGDWAERQPLDAGEWLGGFLTRTAPSSGSDRLIASLVNLAPTLQANPRSALQWTALLSDPAVRLATEERVALRWSAQDPRAAAEFVTGHAALPSSRKQALLAIIQGAARIASEP
jgi:hypothetical protein